MKTGKKARPSHETEKFIHDTLHILSQIEDSLKIEIPSQPGYHPEKILIIGMGGSAICGDIIADMMSDLSPVPIFVIRSTHIPRWVDTTTLAIAISYSGDTLETLTAMENALSKGASLYGISSGGKLERYCTEHRIPHFRLPGGMMPRAALGSMLGACARVITSGEIPAFDILLRAVNECKPISEKIISGEEHQIGSIAKRLRDTIPVIYASSSLLSAARRFKSQLNENAKTLAYVSEFPESAHNDIVGLKEFVKHKGSERITLLALRSKKEPEYTSLMYEAFESVVGQRFFNITSPFEDTPSSLLYHILIGDAVTLKLAEMHGVDPLEIDAITEFKRKLWF